MSALDLGRHDHVTEGQGPRAYEVRTGQRYLHGLEDGEVRHWPEYHLFILDERTGSIMIEGGYGTFSYGWTSRGRDRSLHAFLYSLDFDYFMGKAAKQPHRVPDMERTKREQFAEILRDRRLRDLEKEKARRLWDTLEDAFLFYEDEPQQFTRHLFEDGDWSARLDCSDPIVDRDSPVMRRFWDEVWEAFREQDAIATPAGSRFDPRPLRSDRGMSDKSAIRVDSSAWTGLPSEVRKIDDEWGEFLTEADDAALIADLRRQDLRDRFAALRMLWGPAVRNRPGKNWTVYDGHIRHRGEEWTFWRAVRATVAVILNRYHNSDIHGRGLDSRDMGYWDAGTAGNGYSSAMVCWLYPRLRFQIFSDGD